MFLNVDIKTGKIDGTRGGIGRLATDGSKYLKPVLTEQRIHGKIILICIKHCIKCSAQINTGNQRETVESLSFLESVVRYHFKSMFLHDDHDALLNMSQMFRIIMDSYFIISFKHWTVGHWQSYDDNLQEADP